MYGTVRGGGGTWCVLEAAFVYLSKIEKKLLMTIAINYLNLFLDKIPTELDILETGLIHVVFSGYIQS